MMKPLFVLGTRPEAIKLAPVIRAFEAASGRRCLVCTTGQHREMLASIFDLFGIAPTFDLEVMRPNQSLPGLTALVLERLAPVLRDERPDVVVVQGDTTTAFAAGLAAFYDRLPVAHVEAGLRSGRMDAPFPEEANRRLLAVVADLHFAPTAGAKEALLREGARADRIFVTGNTVVDALHHVRDALRAAPPLIAAEMASRLAGRREFILITAHRRESFAGGLMQMCLAIRDLAAALPDRLFVYPVHLNPNVQAVVRETLSGLDNVWLMAPQPYLDFTWLLMHCCLVITDSGGVQEEAPTFGRFALVMRERTERTEGVSAGLAQLVGMDREEIRRAALDRLLHARPLPDGPNPYGDGRAGERIAQILQSFIARERA